MAKQVRFDQFYIPSDLWDFLEDKGVVFPPNVSEFVLQIPNTILDAAVRVGDILRFGFLNAEISGLLLKEGGRFSCALHILDIVSDEIFHNFIVALLQIK